MEKYTGKTIFKGIAIGKILVISKEEQQVKRRSIKDAELEIERYETAKTKAISQLNGLYQKALHEVGQANASIFEVHTMMLEDEDYNESIRHIISTQNVNAEYAVAITGDNFFQLFANMDDEYMKARSIDVKDISERVISILQGKESSDDIGEHPVIVAAEDLTPSETVQMDREKLLAFVTKAGSSNSHTAILARTMNIPALVGITIQKEWNGKQAVIDGYHDCIYIDPDKKTVSEMMDRQKKDLEKRKLLQQYRNRETVTKRGQRINLYANIGNVADIAGVLENGAEGIGLFRSEFLYMGKDDFPTEEEQFLAYKKAAESMAGKKVIIRTLDIGADKQASCFHLEHEENPAMGYRAIRICLDRTEIFKTQLRALYRASYYGNISIMYPMIISVEEVHKIKKITQEVKDELDQQNIPYKEVEQGVMIETPAAVMMSEELAKEVDFFSIGTNDLTQYTLAIDRQNEKLDSIYDSHHPAVLRMIQMVIQNGHKHNCWVGICGELGADTTLTESFLKMGIDELSVSPTFVLPVRKTVCQIGE